VTRNPRATVEALTARARNRGYTVTELGPWDFDPDTLHLDMAGHGELFEAWFTRHPATGYLRFRYGFRHVGVYGDTYPVLARFREIITPHDYPQETRHE